MTCSVVERGCVVLCCFVDGNLCGVCGAEEQPEEAEEREATGEDEEEEEHEQEQGEEEGEEEEVRCVGDGFAWVVCVGCSRGWVC